MTSNEPDKFKLPTEGNYAIEVYDGAFWLTIEKGLSFGEAEGRKKHYARNQPRQVRIVSITKEPRV